MKSPVKKQGKPMTNGVNGVLKDEDKRKEVVQRISKEMLSVLKEYDPMPSVLTQSLGAVPSARSPPAKRTKLSQLPDTIAGRLSAGSYTSLSALMADVSGVCSALKTVARSGGDADVNVAKIVYFERIVHDLITVERKRAGIELDLVEEVEEDEKVADMEGEKVALTVTGYNGPLFSSLQKPQFVVLSGSSTAASSNPASPRSSTSTAATSIQDFPIKEEVTVDVPFVEQPLPSLVSTVKAVPQDLSSTPKAPTIGEAFPPPSTLLPLQPHRYAKPVIGVKWGGEIGLGGIQQNAELDNKSEPRPHWLQYINAPRPRMSRAPVEPFRKGIGLEPNFVATFSNFAPTCDQSTAKISAAVNNSIWWDRRGQRIYRKIFADDPILGPLVREKPKLKSVSTTTVAVGKGIPAKELENVEINEAEIEATLAGLADNEEIPLDPSLLSNDSPVSSSEATIAEISSLLEKLSSQQYDRFKTGANPSPTDPELATYRNLLTSLGSLISSLPPHITATIDSSPDSPLSVSHRILLHSGTPIYKGALPNDDPNSKPAAPTIQAAALNAMNAAAGTASMSPVAGRAHTPNLRATHSPAPNPASPYQHPQAPIYHHQSPAPQSPYSAPVQPVHYPAPAQPRSPYPAPVAPVAYASYPVAAPQPPPQQPYQQPSQNPAYLQQQQQHQILQQQQQQQIQAAQAQMQQRVPVPVPIQVPVAPMTPQHAQAGYGGYPVGTPQAQMGGQYGVPQTAPAQRRVPGTVQGLSAVGVGGVQVGQIGYGGGVQTPGRYQQPQVQGARRR